ncbi:MBL fold metallo-hydrolase [Candidatus Nanohalovita haloferacivicina]|uniref:MBL fold metallo-hydrolase n=1 Tax=Candidatus Nanohalovita haloferacivicina TaxID=2978046 RepID=UPI00325FA3BF|nr:Metal-dependent hydrolase, beta-lactamase superfamily [Candidatus Nanohalobia archaeon BNXNv]
MKLKFLGTGGGRYVTGQQRRRTAGIIVETEETRLHVDPGPGALVYANKELENPDEVEGLIVSHAHPDHSSDAEPIIEMITEAYDNQASVFANETALNGYGDIEKSISNYHEGLCSRVEKMEEGSEHEFKDLKIESQEMFHGDPRTQGFTLEIDEKKIGFWTDTQYSEELLGLYEDCDVMVIYCTRPKGNSVKGHTAIDEVPDIMENVEASTCIITHFGYALLDSDLDEQKEYIEENIDGKVVFAYDGMEFPGEASLERFS